MRGLALPALLFLLCLAAAHADGQMVSISGADMQQCFSSCAMHYAKPVQSAASSALTPAEERAMQAAVASASAQSAPAADANRYMTVDEQTCNAWGSVPGLVSHGWSNNKCVLSFYLVPSERYPEFVCPKGVGCPDFGKNLDWRIQELKDSFSGQGGGDWMFYVKNGWAKIECPYYAEYCYVNTKPNGSSGYEKIVIQPCQRIVLMGNRASNQYTKNNSGGISYSDVKASPFYIEKRESIPGCG
ncbi:MAG: hypothetical protein LBL21_04285 [Rickettsiales bacterium]|jgi:hypothetical protein|nr:hypothetical protein [Rickettsiales bacterium]